MATVVLAYPYDQAVEVLDGVSRWMVDAPRTIGGGAFLAQPDAAPGNPAATSVLLASTGTAAELSAEVDRLVAGAGTPLSRQDGVQTYRDLMMVVFGCVTMTQAQCHRSGKSDQGQLDRPVYGVERTRLGATPLPTGGWDQVVSAATATDEARAAARRWVGRGFATAPSGRATRTGWTRRYRTGRRRTTRRTTRGWRGSRPRTTRTGSSLSRKGSAPATEIWARPLTVVSPRPPEWACGRPRPPPAEQRARPVRCWRISHG